MRHSLPVQNRIQFPRRRFYFPKIPPLAGVKLVGALLFSFIITQLPSNAAVATVVIGATPGSFAVSSSGAATYAIPIMVPPGTGGVQPGLSLVYNSQGQNGLVGMGFALGGFSAIHRCGRTIVLDNFKGGVNYDANDRFCLDGERLIAISTTEYRTEHESLQKITYTGSATDPTSFTVYSSDGTLHQYGATTDSRIEAQGKTVARLWTLNKIQDPQGNYLTVTYTEDNANGDYRPARVDYTGNSSAGTSPYNSVVFTYLDRADITPQYEGGSVIKVMQRLTNVTTYAGATKVREYRLVYDNNGAVGRSRLTSVQECGTDGVCLNSSNFGWQNGDAGFGAKSNTAWPAGGSPGDRWFEGGDFNGDGKTDALLFEPGNGYLRLSLAAGNGSFEPYVNTYFGSGGSPSDRWFTVADINGDSRSDAVLYMPNSGRIGVALGTQGAALSPALKGSEPFTTPTLAITLPLARSAEQANAKETPVLSTRYPGSCRSAWS